MNEAPATACVTLYRVQYVVDLEACRVRLLERVAELSSAAAGGSESLTHVRRRSKVLGFRRKGGMQAVAEAAGVDRATLRRFFEGKRLTVETFTAIITRGLQIDMQAVLKRVEAVA